MCRYFYNVYLVNSHTFSFSGISRTVIYVHVYNCNNVFPVTMKKLWQNVHIFIKQEIIDGVFTVLFDKTIYTNRRAIVELNRVVNQKRRESLHLSMLETISNWRLTPRHNTCLWLNFTQTASNSTHFYFTLVIQFVAIYYYITSIATALSAIVFKF